MCEVRRAAAGPVLSIRPLGHLSGAEQVGHARLDEHQPEEGAVAYLEGRIEDGVLSDGSA